MTLRRVLLAVLGLVVLAVAGAAGAWWWNDRQTGDVRGSSTREFVTTEVTTTRPQEEIETEPWPLFGLTPNRTRDAVDFHHQPPYREVWQVRGGALVEFPPVVAYGRLYFASIRGSFYAVEAETGKIDWRRDLGYVSAASPAVGDGVVYQPLMAKRGAENDATSGLLVALDAETGDEIWRFQAGAVESSPLLVDGTLYFGTFDDRLYALDAKSKRVLWSYKAGDDVKGGPAYSSGAVFFGSYDGNVYSVEAESGKLRWKSGGRSGLLGSGNFYAGPAIAYGRVYIGNTDGKVYAFGARTGDLLWAKTTGNYVYSSAAVSDRVVFAGSYDGRLYALDAATGDVKWSFEAHGPISGSPTVMEGLVYFSTFAGKTFALETGNGDEVWTFPDGRYTPLVADEDRTYVVGRSKVYALEER